MPNNIWDGMNFNDAVKEKHESLVEKMDLPEWVEIPCPYCHASLPKRCLRTISFHFNASEIGDISIEVCCDSCGIAEQVYFKYAFKNKQDIIDLLKESSNPSKMDELIQIRKDKLIQGSSSNLLTEMGVQTSSIYFKG